MVLSKSCRNITFDITCIWFIVDITQVLTVQPDLFFAGFNFEFFFGNKGIQLIFWYQTI